MTDVELTRLTKRFGETTAVDAVDLDIRSGELFFLLGPSGCGKTTLLRMIAGFIEPSGGTIRFGQREVTDVPPNRRNTGMVFQSYALWPHMTVSENVAYGLNVRGIGSDARRDRVRGALEAVQMFEYAERRPTQLSGGQQQRVALARALVIEPTVLLLDEPLSNLDAKLRLEMRTEIRRICVQTGITAIYVTHDQKEALSMADRIAVLRDGRVVQVGPPRELYDRPCTRFVADFLGESNFINATVTRVDGDKVELETTVGTLHSTVVTAGLVAGTDVVCSLRPESIQIDSEGERHNQLDAVTTETVYLGETVQYVLKLPDGSSLKTIELNPKRVIDPGKTVQVTIHPQDIVLIRVEPMEAAVRS